MKKRFDKKYLDGLKPKKGRYEVGDTGCNGLIVRVQPTGSKSLYVIFKIRGAGAIGVNGQRLAGPQQRILLGRWGIELHTGEHVKELRKRANDIMDLAHAGTDPREPERRSKANTVESVVRAYIADHGPSLARPKELERRMEMHVLPTLGPLHIAKVDKEHIKTLLSSQTVGTAREVRKHLVALYNWAIDGGLVTHNPAKGVQKDRLVANTNAGYTLKEEELRAAWAAMLEMGYPYGDMYRLLLLTGQRWSEWCEASWSEIGNGELIVPAARYKTRVEHATPLAPACKDIVDALPFRDRDSWLFFNKTMEAPANNRNMNRKRLSPLAQKYLRKQLKKPEAKLHHFRIHDFRHTCETRMTKLGVITEVRDAVLGHAKQGMTKQYNTYEYWKEKTEALELYEQHILGIVS